MTLEPHYEIRQTIINHQLGEEAVTLNIGIRYKDAQGEQIGPPSGMDVTLEDTALNGRAQGRGRPVWDEDDVLEEAKNHLGTQKVTLKLPEPVLELDF